MNILILSIYVGCYQMMKYISRPSYSDNNQLLDPGLDLNMEGGMGELVFFLTPIILHIKLFTMFLIIQ